MPKRVKQTRKLKTTAKPKRPSDPNKAAHAMMVEHMARLDPEPEPTSAVPLDF